MDLKISFLNNLIVINGVTTYEELIAEITQQKPYLNQINLSYTDDEGDQIQVSNTSDLFAISNPDQTTIFMEAQEDKDKIQEEQKKAEQLKKVQEMKQKQKEQAKVKKIEQIAKEKELVENLKVEIENLKLKNQEELTKYEETTEKLKNFKLLPLPDFSEQVKSSQIFDLVREKESQLLMLEGKKEFDTQLKTMKDEIHNAFHQLYAPRVSQFQANYTQWKQNQAAIKKLDQEIEAFKIKTLKQLSSNGEKLKIHDDKIVQFEKELLEMEQQQQ